MSNNFSIKFQPYDFVDKKNIAYAESSKIVTDYDELTQQGEATTVCFGEIKRSVWGGEGLNGINRNPFDGGVNILKPKYDEETGEFKGTTTGFHAIG